MAIASTGTSSAAGTKPGPKASRTTVLLPHQERWQARETSPAVIATASHRERAASQPFATVRTNHGKASIDTAPPRNRNDLAISAAEE